MSLNVNPDVEDVYYRYKMPRINVKVEGKGNGIKTVITNMNEIAKSIYRKPAYPIKYFGFELGSQTNIDDKNEKYIVNGAHDGSKLQETLYNFIKKFVLCSKCGNPETTLTIKKKSEKVTTKCKACGEVGSLDLKHRLTPYIIKNPPSNETEGAAPAKTEGVDEVDQPDFDCPELPEKLDEHLSELTLKEAKPVAPVDNKDTKTLSDELFSMVMEKFRAGTLLEERLEIRRKIRTLRLKESSVMVIMEAVFVSAPSIVEDICKYRKLLQIFTRTGPQREKFQQYVIAGMMLLCDKFKIYQYAINLLFALYDNDVIEEEVITEWFEKGPSKKYVIKKRCQEILDSCGPMIDWLKTADEESGPDDDDDSEAAEGDKVRYRNGVQMLQFVTPSEPLPQNDDEEEYDPDEAFDIDAI